MRIIPRVVCTVVAVEEVIAGFFKDLYCLFGLFESAAYFGELLTRDRALIKAARHRTDGVAQGYRVVISADLLDLPDYFTGKAQTVLKTSAVSVRPVVGVRHRELVEQIAFMNRVDLDSVDPRILAELSALAERVHEPVYHLRSEEVHLYIRSPDIRQVRIRSGPPPFGHYHSGTRLPEYLIAYERLQHGRKDHGSAGSGAELEEDLCSALMYFLYYRFDRLKHFRVLVKPLLSHDADHRDKARYEQPDIVVLSIPVQVLYTFNEPGLSFPRYHVGAFHRQHHDAVFYLYISHLPRCEQRSIFFVHGDPPVCMDTV